MHPGDGDSSDGDGIVPVFPSCFNPFNTQRTLLQRHAARAREAASQGLVPLKITNLAPAMPALIDQNSIQKAVAQPKGSSSA